MWAFTYDNYARHYDGSSWTAIPLPGIPYAATGTASNDIWVGSDKGVLYHWDGTAFSTVKTADTGSAILGIHSVAPNFMVLAGLTSVQTWDGATFSISAHVSTRSVWGTSPTDIWAGSSNTCTVYHYDG